MTMVLMNTNQHDGSDKVTILSPETFKEDCLTSKSVRYRYLCTSITKPLTQKCEIWIILLLYFI